MYRLQTLIAALLLMLANPGFAVQGTEPSNVDNRDQTVADALIRDSHIDAQLDWRSYYLGRIEAHQQSAGRPGAVRAASSVDSTN